MNDLGAGRTGFDRGPFTEADVRFLLEKATEHRRRLETLHELLLSDGHYGTGATPAALVYSEGSMRVLRLTTGDGRPFPGPPLIFVPAPVSRYFILDLAPGRSLAAHVAAAGFDTYIIDFGVPGDEDRFADLDWYVNGLMRRALRAVRAQSGAASVDVVGYCLGGVLSLLYAAIHPEEVTRLTVLTTLVDSSVEGGIAWMATKLGLDGESYDHPRVVPAATIKSWFEALAPGSNSQEARVADLLAQLDLPIERLQSVRTMASWVDDVVPASGRLLAELSARLGPAANELMTGRTVVGGQQVDLARITMPVLSVSAARDHISPPDGCDAIAEVVPHARVLRVAGGHVGAIAGSRAAGLWDTIAQFHLDRIGLHADPADSSIDNH